MPKHRQQGFTVIELILVFVVLAVVAGLLALAVDVYRVRGQVGHSLEAAQPAREVLERFFVDTGRAPL
ncbi:MAG: prepilin-type N-terminal cleavage/methylation domain-containing protein, partial [Proteobacteria bacterium]|nr:prepilin-type N-terminal cleavage/methylation domain-containing protein [Pseudomonadota bacterium]